MSKEKHVFFVHSPITLLVAWGVINLKKLEPEQVIFLTHRGFSVPVNEFKTFDFPYSWSPEPFPFKLNFLLSWKRLKNFDDWVSQITKNYRFVVYLPHSQFRVLKLLITHKSCFEYNYLEEGLGSYEPIEMANPRGMKARVNILDQILYKNRIRDRLIYNSSYGAVFGLFEECFPGFRNKYILAKDFLQDPVFVENLKMKQEINDFENSHIIVLDAISAHGIVSKDQHLAAVLRLKEILLNRGIKKFFIKFHPAQLGTEEYEIFLGSLNYGLKDAEIIEIDQSVYLEILALKCASATFYVNISSVGLYAAKFGQPVYTWANFLTDKNERFRKFFYALNEEFLKNLIFLDNEVVK